MSLPGMTRGEMKRTSFQKPEMLLAPWLRVGGRGMIHARPGLGKSWLAMSVAMCVAGAGRMLDWQAMKAAPVLFIDAEMTLAELDERQDGLTGAIGGLDEVALDENLRTVSKVDFDNDDGADGWPTPESDADRIYRWAMEHDARLVVFDNLRGLTDVTDENVATEWRPLHDLCSDLKTAGVATLLVHHDDKRGQDFSGSDNIQVPIEARLHLQRQPWAGAGEASFRLTYRKDRHGKNQDRVVGVAMRGDLKVGEQLQWVVGDDVDEPKASAKVSLGDQCRNLMVQAQADYWPNKAAFMRDYGCSMPTLNKHIDAAVKLGYVASRSAFAEVLKENPGVDCEEPEF